MEIKNFLKIALKCSNAINSISSWINIHENIPRKTKIISNYPPTQIPLHPPTNRSIATTILGETGCLSPYTYIYIYIYSRVRLLVTSRTREPLDSRENIRSPVSEPRPPRHPSPRMHRRLVLGNIAAEEGHRSYIKRQQETAWNAGKRGLRAPRCSKPAGPVDLHTTRPASPASLYLHSNLPVDLIPPLYYFILLSASSPLPLPHLL